MIFDRDNWQEILLTLKKNKLRSFLTAFGVFWGVFMLVVMLGAGKGLYNGVMKDFSRMATNSVFIWARPTTQPYKGFPRGRRFHFTNEDMQALRQQIREIEHIAPRNQLGGHRGMANVTRGLKNGAFNIYGDVPEYIFIKHMDILSGRFVNQLDMEEKRKVAVIGTHVLKVLFPPGEDPIGKSIRINGVYFKVVGVFGSIAEGDDAEEETQTVFVPFTTFQHAFNFGNRISWFSLTSQKDIPVSVVEKKAIAFLAMRHQVAPDDRLAFGSWNSEKEFNKMNNLFSGITALIWFVGVFTLIAGVIGVSNIMLVIVKERTREIGIKRAVGATPVAVIGQIIMEAVLLTSAAGYIGLVFGVALVESVSNALKAYGNKVDMFRNPEVDLTAAIIALTILVVSGALAGLIPGKRAVSVKPVEAIRDK